MGLGTGLGLQGLCEVQGRAVHKWGREERSSTLNFHKQTTLKVKTSVQPLEATCIQWGLCTVAMFPHIRIGPLQMSVLTSKVLATALGKNEGE